MTEQLQVPVCRVIDMPFPEDKITFRTYVPEFARPARTFLDDDLDDDEPAEETKVVRRGRRPRPKATEGAETK